MAKRPSTKSVDGRQQLINAANPSQVHTKKRLPVLRYRKKVLDPSPEPQHGDDDNQLDEPDDTTSSCHDNQSSRMHESSPVKVHPIPSSKVYVVNVQDFLFHPRHIVVERHSTIRWEIPANSTTVHSIHVGWTKKKPPPSTTNAPTLSVDTPTFEHTFDTLGTIRYSCALYSFMTGSVTVVAALTPDDTSRNAVFLDYPHPRTVPTSPRKQVTVPFHKQLVTWREKQPPRPKVEDDDTFARKSRQRIKTKANAATKHPQSPAIDATPPPLSTPPATPITSPKATTPSSLYVAPLTAATSPTNHHVILLQDFAFSITKSSVVAAVGDAVSWVVSPENPGMVEHALQLRVLDQTTLVHTATSPPLKPGDRWSFALWQPCTLSVRCVVYDLVCPSVQVVRPPSASEVDQPPPPTDVILIGDVACPVATAVSSPPTEGADEGSILELLHKSTLKQRASRSSYEVEHGRAIPGFDAAAAYDLMKQRTYGWN
ncbi:hypothetical protein DYB30_000088 [Aphanomyces astaci]|uniref:Uncharacterized protein n=1 Tax=Aphanomyces astaci TaxID=112090 RepID=A0A397DCA9_APHAT|nr:hypothetical protein DYB30_000088 [Aphanomyces astaci]RHY82471.1 hypothetical protein DYB26_000460 [Aphanomyces astaci]